jgi:hypothetical protein
MLASAMRKLLPRSERRVIPPHFRHNLARL